MHYNLIFSALLAVVAIVIASPFPEAVVPRTVQPITWVAILKTDGRILVADGSPNGLYMAYNETHAAYYGEASAEQLASVHSLAAAPVPDEFTCAPSCNGQQHSTSDISTAEQGLQSWFGSGLGWHGSITYFYNSVYAFGCDYGNGQTTTSSDYSASVACVDRNCGTTQGGWDSIRNWKVTYGREFGSFGC